MRLLVTGATGFIGSRVMRRAARSFPGEVVAVARTAPPTMRDEVRHVAVDLLDAEGTGRAIRRIEATHLLHLAWDVTPGRYWMSASNVEWLEASLRLYRLFAAAGGERIVSVGTCAEYDWRDGVLGEDRTPLRPASLYGVAKNCLRAMLEAAAPQLSVSWAWARLFWLYGPGEGAGRLLPDIARAVLAGEEAAMSAGLQRRDYLHVDDVARALLHILVSGHEGAINIGSGEPVEVRRIAEMFAGHLGRPDLLRAGARAGGLDEAPLVVADGKRLATSGFRPELTLDAGLADTADWWRATR